MALSNTDLITELYVGYFNRAPDPAGLQYWLDALSKGVTFTQVADYFATSAEAKAIYPYLSLPGIVSPDSFVTGIYNNILNRAPDASGLAYWSGLLQSGKITPGGAIGAILSSVNLQTGTPDALTLANKVTVGEYYVTTTANANTPYTQDSAKAAIAGVTNDSATVVSSKATVDAYVASGASGITVTLTTNIDSPGAAAPAANTLGTAANDTYNSASGTLQTGDVIDGKGGNDILKYVSTAAATVLPTISNVETFSVTSVAGVAELNLLNSSGYKTLESSGGSAGVKFSSLGTIADAHIVNTTGGSFELAYAAATVAGTADTQKLLLDSATVAGGLTVNGIETLAITSTGKDTVTGVADAALKTVTSAGAGELTLTGFTSAVLTSFDGSAATGAQKIDFSTTASDVAVKGGSANDVFTFGGTFTSKDTVDGGNGTDTVALAGADFRLATADGTKGINAFVSVEAVDFTGATGANIDQATLTNSAITKFIFDTTGNDTIDSANGTTLFSTGINNAGNETFVVKAGNTTLNLALEGKAQTATTAFDDADIGTLDTGGALTIKLSSTGVDSLKVANVDFNDITAVTNAAGATFTVTGDANTTIGGFSNAVNVDASGLSGLFKVSGSGANDFIKGGTNQNEITGGAGVDTIDISASSTKVDTIHINAIVASADRDAVTGFTTGAGGDILDFNNTDTTFANAGTVAIQSLTSSGAQTFLTATNDVLIFNNALSGTNLGDGSAGSLNGTNLLADVGTIATNSASAAGYILAYQGGNAYLYHAVDANNDNSLVNTEIQLVGTLSGVAAGSVTAANFHIT